MNHRAINYIYLYSYHSCGVCTKQKASFCAFNFVYGFVLKTAAEIRNSRNFSALYILRNKIKADIFAILPTRL